MISYLLSEGVNHSRNSPEGDGESASNEQGVVGDGVVDLLHLVLLLLDVFLGVAVHFG